MVDDGCATSRNRWQPATRVEPIPHPRVELGEPQMQTKLRWMLIVVCVSCGDGESTSDGGAPPDSTVVSDTDADSGPTGPTDAEPAPMVVDRVSGDLTYVELHGPAGRRSGHIYSLQASGTARLQITRIAAVWSHHAVSPDRQRIVAVRHGDGDGDGHPDLGGPGEVWMISLRQRQAYPISPEGCNAGIGGVGWRDGVRVVYAMACGEAPSAAYLAHGEDRSRDPGQLLRLTDHDRPVRDVFPAVGTPFLTYVVDAEICVAAGECFVKPEIWLADADVGIACRLTDGDRTFTNRATVTGSEIRLGDHTPSFNAQISSVVFSRNVGEKPSGPAGHHDLFQVNIEHRALAVSSETCDAPGSLVDLSSTFVDDDYPQADGARSAADERFPQMSSLDVGSLLYTTRSGAGAEEDRRIWQIDMTGTQTALTAADVFATHARWVVPEYTLSGDRPLDHRNRGLTGPLPLGR